MYWFLWPISLAWLLVCCLYKEVYLQSFKCVSFWLHGRCVEWEGWAHKPVNHTSWVAVVTPTGRPKSVRNRYLIELFCGVVCVVTLPFWHFCWYRIFCYRTESDLRLFVFCFNCSVIQYVWLYNKVVLVQYHKGILAQRNRLIFRGPRSLWLTNGTFLSVL